MSVTHICVHKDIRVQRGVRPAHSDLQLRGRSEQEQALNDRRKVL